MDIDEPDNEHSTALHWACFTGSDTAIYYLLAWGASVNLQDIRGNTSLHLAIMSAEMFPSKRAIKELLIKGASRDILTKEGKNALDLSKELKDEILGEELS